MSRFSKCFPVDNGTMMLCYHWNGNAIKFPINKEKSPKDKSLNDISEEGNLEK